MPSPRDFLTVCHICLNIYKITMSLTDNAENEKDDLENKKQSVLIKQN